MPAKCILNSGKQGSYLATVKQTERTKAHAKKKTHLKINQPGGKNH